MLDSFFDMAPKRTIPIVEAKVHAKLGASGSGRWTICHVSPRMEEGLPDTSGEAANTGTICHDLSEKCLKADDDVLLSMALNKNALVHDDGTVTYRLGGESSDGGIVVTQDMIDWAQTYIEFVREMVKAGGTLMVEARLSIEHITGEPDAKGTSDSVVLFPPDELTIIDLKCGFKKVYAKYKLEGLHFSTAPKDIQMEALFAGGPSFKPNTQLVMYAEAARNELQDQLHKLKRIRYIIVQPTLDHIDEYVVSVEEHLKWVAWISEQAENTRDPMAKAHPSPDVCQFCKAYPCYEAERMALEVAFESFEKMDAQETRRPSVQELGKMKRMLPMLRKYCDFIDARTRAELEANRPVDGYKLVAGDEGDRKWGSEFDAEFLLQEAGLPQIEYTKRSLISPAQAEKLTKGKKPKLSKAAWGKLQTIIHRAPPSGTKVVEDIDPRPAITIDLTSSFDFD